MRWMAVGVVSFDPVKTGDYALRVLHRWEFCMTTVTVSKKYQIVMPREMRQAMGIRPGQKLQVVLYEGRAELIPVRDITEMRGFLRGIETDVPRDGDRV